MSPATTEAIKETLRTGLLALGTAVVVALQSDRFDWKLIAIAVLTAILRGVDKGIHESKDIKADGLVPF